MRLLISKTTSALGLMLYAVLMLSACSEKIDPQASLAQAKKHLAEKGQQPAAIIELKNALQANPDLAEARYLLGKSYREQGAYQIAEVELRKAVALRYDLDKSIPELIRSMLGQGQAEKVIADFANQKLQSTDAQADIATLIGLAYLSSGKLDLSMARFAAAQQIKPGFDEAVLGEARILATKKDFPAAHIKVDSVLSRSPQSVEALMLKANLFRAQKQADEALKVYEAVFVLDPENFAAHMDAAQIELNRRKLESVRVHADAMRKIAPKHPMVNYFDALLALRDKQLPKAKEAILQALAGAPNEPQILLLAATIELQLNELSQGEQHLTLVIRKQPGNILAHQMLIALHITQKELTKAEEALQQAITKIPNNQDLLNLAGDLATAKGDFDQATRYFQQATAINPKNTHGLTQNAMIQLSRGENAEAYAALEEASKLEPNNARPDLMRVLAHLQHKEYDQALKSWNSLQKRQPDNPLVYNLQAGIYLGKQDAVNARKALEHALSIDPAYFPALTNLANLDLRENKPDAAKQRYRAILQKDSKNLSVLLSLANLEQSTGAPKTEVVRLLNQARQANPNALQATLALVKYHLSENDGKQALAVIDDALKADPKDPQLLAVAGATQLQAKQPDQAVQTYKKLVEQNPKLSGPLLSLGEAQIAAGQLYAADQTLSSALALQPDSAEVQVFAVNAFLKAGKTDDALKMLAQIQKAAPKSMVLPELEGNIRMARREYAGATAAYRKAFTASPSLGMMIKLDQALRVAGNPAEADVVLNNWLKINPADQAAKLYAAEVAIAAKDYAKAVTRYRALLNTESQNPAVLNNLALASFQMNDPKALDYAEKAVAIAPKNPAILDTFGWILVEKGQIKRGVGLLEQASALSPKQWAIRLHLAKALIKDGRKEEARSHLQTIVKANAASIEGKESAQLLNQL